LKANIGPTQAIGIIVVVALVILGLLWKMNFGAPAGSSSNPYQTSGAPPGFKGGAPPPGMGYQGHQGAGPPGMNRGGGPPGGQNMPTGPGGGPPGGQNMPTGPGGAGSGG